MWTTCTLALSVFPKFSHQWSVIWHILLELGLLVGKVSRVNILYERQNSSEAAHSPAGTIWWVVCGFLHLLRLLTSIMGWMNCLQLRDSAGLHHSYAEAATREAGVAVPLRVCVHATSQLPVALPVRVPLRQPQLLPGQASSPAAR